MKALSGLLSMVTLATFACASHLQPSVGPPECPIPETGEVLNITFYPNEDDCSKYWECDNGNLYNGSCPDGLVWNPNEDACDWPYNYNCPYDKRSKRVRHVGSSRAAPECPIPEPGQVLNITFYPNEEDCNKYWECDNGKLYNGSCPDDLVWNPNEDACDWPYNYDCPYDKRSERVRYVGSSRAIPECPIPEPGQVLNMTFYPNEEDCNKYWECDNGNLYNGSCPDDLVWNPNEDACDWPYNYDCPYDKRSERVRHVASSRAIPECPIPEPGQVLNITFYPNEEDCNKYWECDNGKLYNGSCPDDLVWNPNEDACDWPYNYDCPYDKRSKRVRHVGSSKAIPECPIPEPGQVLNITFYPNDEDCSKYWECDNGNLYNGSCPDGLIWNPNVDSCDWPFNYDCPIEEVKTAVRPIIPASGDKIVCPPPDPSGHGNVTFFPNEENCHKYWECDNGQLIMGDCLDLVWNPTINSCDWEYNYPCSAKPPATEARPAAHPVKPVISVLPARKGFGNFR